MENKFKAGDRVIAKYDRDGGVIAGEAYIVEANAMPAGSFTWMTLRGHNNSTIDDSYREIDFDLALTFKVGDRVNLLDGHPYGCFDATQGPGTITAEAGAAYRGDWHVAIDNYTPSHRHLTFKESELELIGKPTNSAIVALLAYGRPRPAVRPHVHCNSDLAIAEAERLARTNPGDEFGVYEFVTSRKEAKRYDREWQNLAANGNKIHAIKELRSVTGLALKTTKDAVEEWLRLEAA